jgi:hypothetical protein
MPFGTFVETAGAVVLPALVLAADEDALDPVELPQPATKPAMTANDATAVADFPHLIGWPPYHSFRIATPQMSDECFINAFAWHPHLLCKRLFRKYILIFLFSQYLCENFTNN